MQQSVILMILKNNCDPKGSLISHGFMGRYVDLMNILRDLMNIFQPRINDKVPASFKIIDSNPWENGG